MKKLVFVFAVLAVVMTSCGGGSDSIIGTWQLDSVSGEELTESEKSATMTFNEDGSCIQKRGEKERKMTWTLSEDGKTLTVKKESGSEDVMENVELSGDKLSFSEGNDKITLKKI